MSEVGLSEIVNRRLKVTSVRVRLSYMGHVNYNSL